MTDLTPQYANLDDLLVEVDDDVRDVLLSTGKTVRVRGMTRAEMMLSRKGTEDPAVIEQRMIAFCLVTPKLTPKQVEQWQRRTTPMVMAPVTEAIRELSGLGEGADKSSLRTDGDES